VQRVVGSSPAHHHFSFPERKPVLKKRLLIGLGWVREWRARFTEFQLKNRKGQDTRNIMIVRISMITADAMEFVDSVLEAI